MLTTLLQASHILLLYKLKQLSVNQWELIASSQHQRVFRQEYVRKYILEVHCIMESVSQCYVSPLYNLCTPCIGCQASLDLGPVR